MHCKKRKKTDTERVKIFIADCKTVSKTLTANNTNEIVLINRPKGLSLENKLTKFYHNPSLKKFKCRATRVSVQGVESLWGDCRFIPADWGS